ncbi:MAG: ATP-grasp domain-containing protein, partial [Ignisphaera sp.]
MLDIGEIGVVGGSVYEDDNISIEYTMNKIKNREPYWPIWVAKAFKYGIDEDTIYGLTGIDKHFLKQIKELVYIYEDLKKRNLDDPELPKLIAEAKRKGFSDEQIAKALRLLPDILREYREKHGITPVVKQIDTLAAEWPAQTNYLYLTYNGWEHDIDFSSSKPKIIVLGAGGFRIGVSVEFDWCVVAFSDEARSRGYEVIVVNYNPETVSTDWDINEKLYFDEISVERILDIYKLEKPTGVVAFLGGQIANNIAWELEKRNIVLLGTSGKSVHIAENRALFSELLDKLKIKQPKWITATNIKEVLKFVDEVGFPVLIRPSYVLSGTAMAVAKNVDELLQYVSKAAKISPQYPVVISKFIDNAVEFEFDGVGDRDTVIGAFIEHIEPAGVHSGDATMVLPPKYLPRTAILQAAKIVKALSSSLEIKGPFNVQMLYKDGDVYVIELNLRASRSMPFTSKVTGYNLMNAAAEVALEGMIRSVVERGKLNLLVPRWYGVKSPQFSWSRLRGAYPFLGSEMRSVGEVASISNVYEEALMLSWLSVQENRVPNKNEKVLIYTPNQEYVDILSEVAKILNDMAYATITIESMDIKNAEVLSIKQAEKELMNKSIGIIMTTGYKPEKDYAIRRTAADMVIPLVLNHKLAYELAKAMNYLKNRGNPEVKDLKEHWVKVEDITEVYG